VIGWTIPDATLIGEGMHIVLELRHHRHRYTELPAARREVIVSNQDLSRVRAGSGGPWEGKL
jgi:hypothetical protein